VKENLQVLVTDILMGKCQGALMLPWHNDTSVFFLKKKVSFY